jgi:hypothetical protein
MKRLGGSLDICSQQNDRCRQAENRQQPEERREHGQRRSMPRISFWIPAFAGMTACAGIAAAPLFHFNPISGFNLW